MFIKMVRIGCCYLVAKSCPTLRSLMDYNPPGSSGRGISQARILEQVAISFSRGSLWPRDGTQVSCTAGRLFTSEPMLYSITITGHWELSVAVNQWSRTVCISIGLMLQKYEQLDVMWKIGNVTMKLWQHFKKMLSPAWDLWANPFQLWKMY